MQHNYITIGYNKTCWADTTEIDRTSISMETLLYHIRFLIDNIYIKVGNKIFKQSIVLSSDPRADETGGGEGESCAVCRHIGWRTHHHSSASATPGSSSPCLLKRSCACPRAAERCDTLLMYTDITHVLASLLSIHQ